MMPKTLKIFTALPIVCAVSAIAVFGFGPSAALADSVVVVSPSDMGGWTFVNRDGNTGDVKTPTTGSMVNGPDTPPAGTGSANLTLPTNNGGDSSALRGSGFAGIALTSLTTLQYSTYDTANNGQQFPYFGLVVSADGGTTVDTLFFEPPYQTPSAGNPSLPDQGAPVQGQWQTWNALAGAWWDNLGLSVAGSTSDNPPPHSSSFGDLLAALAADWGVAEDAIKIVNTTDEPGGNPLGGVRFDVGFADGDVPYNGYVDAFKIGVNGVNTTYDFEASGGAATPLPAALPLFATGLGALGIVGWRRKRKAKAAT
jgi:hypothetical protein